MKTYRILNLGAGVQSTTLFLLAADGEIEQYDYAIFADTQDEPTEVYSHLEWLRSVPNGPPILTDTAGNLGDDLIAGVNSNGGKFVTIPAFSAIAEGEPISMVKRQCTSDYKIKVVEMVVKRSILNLRKYGRIPKDVVVLHSLGFSIDEPGRAARTRKRFAGNWQCEFPLIDLEMTRRDCVNYLDGRVPHEVPRSACVFCPFKSNAEWLRLKRNDPDGWKRAVEIDEAIRGDNILHRNTDDQQFYIHKTCRPLKTVNLDEDQKTLFDLDCEGGCGL